MGREYLLRAILFQISELQSEIILSEINDQKEAPPPTFTPKFLYRFFCFLFFLSVNAN